MIRNALLMGVVLSLAASACAPQATATVNPLDIQHTAEAAAFTMIAQTEEAGPTATLNLANETKPKGTVTLSLYVVTELGECGYLSQQFEANGSLSGPVGQYSAGAFVDGKKDFKVFGGFRITQGSWTIVVRNESIVAQGGCFPNC